MLHHNSAKVMCPYGHTYSEHNTYITPQGSRVCRCCQRIRQRRCYQKFLERRRARAKKKYWEKKEALKETQREVR